MKTTAESGSRRDPKQIQALVDRFSPLLVELFSEAPDYGTLGFTVHFTQNNPTRVEWAGSHSFKLEASR